MAFRIAELFRNAMQMLQIRLNNPARELCTKANASAQQV
jgi:hypothetical protein